MDLQTMQKKVKAHVYKNKQEFAADLNLIWDNCLTYNSDPSHPLRRSAMFMRKKADHILERITDKNERPQPVNVRLLKPPPAQHYAKSRTIESSDEEDSGTPLANGRTNHQPNGIVNGAHPKGPNGIVPTSLPNGTATHDEPASSVLGKRRVSRPDDMPFLERPAIVRTPQSMATFRDVDLEMQRYLDSEGAGPSRLPSNSFVRQDIGQRVQKKLKTMTDDDQGVYYPYDTLLGLPSVDAPVPTRRKVPRSSLTKNQQCSTPDRLQEDGRLLGGWWQAMGDPTVQGSGLPQLPQSEDLTTTPVRTKRKRSPSVRHRKRVATDSPPQGLKGLMERNIQTLRKMRKTHYRLNALQAGEEPRPLSPPPRDDGARGRKRRSGKLRGAIPLEGGKALAKSRMDALGSMLLEHAGFEGASKAALSVLTDAAADFMMNLGRTLRFYTDKYGQNMTPEEIILHTLFENGTLEIQELERYIKDDVERYGYKISELERKLTQAYNDQVEPLTIEDDALFEEGGDALISGNWTDMLGEDFFGFRALGLDKELGMTTFSVPSRLFHGKAKRQDAAALEAASKEPPPPYPPPLPFILVSNNPADPPIGLLQPFYREKFEKLAATTAATTNPPTTAEGPHPQPPPNPHLTLPDDPPDPLKVKSGPLGQITLPTNNTKAKPPKAPGPGKGNGKKKAAGDDPSSGAGAPGGTGGASSTLSGLAATGGGSFVAGPSDASGGNAPNHVAMSANPGEGVANAGATAGTPSPTKRKSKASKKKASSGPAPAEAPQAGPIVMATA
ncbi:Transcriptional activator spt7 [Tulasnella sp. 403]|nr:Transcriptional activator spt7 [Tulasnella sp. 403]